MRKMSNAASAQCAALRDYVKKQRLHKDTEAPNWHWHRLGGVRPLLGSFVTLSLLSANVLHGAL